MRRSIPVATLLLAAACGALRGNVLSYAQYRSLEKGMAAKAVLRAFGEPDDLMEHEGRITGLTYRCENAKGEAAVLRLGFSKQGGLTKWVLKDR